MEYPEDDYYEDDYYEEEVFDDLHYAFGEDYTPYVETDEDRWLKTATDWQRIKRFYTFPWWIVLFIHVKCEKYAVKYIHKFHKGIKRTWLQEKLFRIASRIEFKLRPCLKMATRKK